MRNKQVRNKRLLHIVLTLLLLVVTVFGGQVILPAFAETQEYSNVMDDLRKDENFTVSDYPIVSDDYSLQVIQVAESVNEELFVYVYQPSRQTKDITATSININYTNYKLLLINSVDVFYKYKVNGFAVKSENSVRQYNVTSIFRKFDKTIDEGKPGNTINEVPYEVGQEWTACTYNGDVVYTNTEVETITITDKFVGCVRYFNGVSWFTSGACDSHFVAFSTDRKIDKLYEVELSFVTKTYDKNLFGIKYGDEVPYKNYTVSDKEEASNTVNGIFARSYTWKRIQSTKDFLKSDVELADGVADEISKQDWLLFFYETEFTGGVGGATAALTGWIGALIGAQNAKGTLVSEVTILRLKFETAGKTYNLGAVDNKQTGSAKPVGGIGIDLGQTGFGEFIGNSFKNTFSGLAAWWEIVVVVALIVLAVIAVCLVVRLIRFVIDSFKSKHKTAASEQPEDKHEKGR